MNGVFLVKAASEFPMFLKQDDHKVGVPLTDEMRMRWSITHGHGENRVSRAMEHRYRSLFAALVDMRHHYTLLTLGVDEGSRTLHVPKEMACAVYRNEKRVVLLHKGYDHKPYPDIFSWGRDEHATHREMLLWEREGWEKFFDKLLRRAALEELRRSHVRARGSRRSVIQQEMTRLASA